MKMFFKIFLSLLVLLMISPQKISADTCVQSQGIKAFPSAEGYGAKASGGRGGRVYEVTNLNNSGAGSLRECVEAVETRICTFKVGGVITLTEELKISNPNITIAGQTAPNYGVTLSTQNIDQPPLKISTSNVIIRYLKLRPNTQIVGVDQVDGLTIDNPRGDLSNIVIDHISVSFSIDEALNTWGNSNYLTIQKSIFSYSLNGYKNGRYIHKDNIPHSKGPLFGDNRGGFISFHHNMLAHNIDRNPGIRTGSGPVEVINNIIYSYHDPSITGAYGGTQVQVDFINNYYSQSSTYQSQWKSNYGVKLDTFGDINGTSIIYVKGNIGPSRTQQEQPEENIVDPEDRGKINPNKFSNPDVTVNVDETQYIIENLTKDVGANGFIDCTGNLVISVDPLDQRAINEYKNKTGSPINLVSDVGFPNHPETMSTCIDSDNDKIPDEWEENYFSSLNSVGDSQNSLTNNDYDGDGYTDFEEYLNSTDPTSDNSGCQNTPTPTPSTTPLNKYDVVQDGVVDILDIIDVIKYLFGN